METESSLFRGRGERAASASVRAAGRDPEAEERARHGEAFAAGRDGEAGPDLSLEGKPPRSPHRVQAGRGFGGQEKESARERRQARRGGGGGGSEAVPISRHRQLIADRLTPYGWSRRTVD